MAKKHRNSLERTMMLRARRRAQEARVPSRPDHWRTGSRQETRRGYVKR